MRRTATEYIRHLELRVARLERQATHPLDIYHPSELVDGYIDRDMDMNYRVEEARPSSKEKEIASKLTRKGYGVKYNQAIGNILDTSNLGYSDSDLRNPDLREYLVKKVMADLGLRGQVKDNRGEKYFKGSIDGFIITIVCGGPLDGLSFNISKGNSRLSSLPSGQVYDKMKSILKSKKVSFYLDGGQINFRSAGDLFKGLVALGVKKSDAQALSQGVGDQFHHLEGNNFSLFGKDLHVGVPDSEDIVDFYYIDFTY
jgi:hypothetical protein